jgi:DNA-binding NtrC family response regulator
MGTEAEVEISAVLGTGAAADTIAVVIRDITRRLAPEIDGDPLRIALSSITGQVGRTPLPVLVRDTTEVIERHCIDTALALANGRRSAAAELLGLSRQSLYMKLARYGVDAEAETARDATG